MKIFVLTSRFPFPLEKGDKLRIYHQIKHLSQRNQIVLCALSDHPVKDEWLDELRPFCENIYIFRIVKWFSFARAILVFLLGGSLQLGYFHRWFLFRKVRKLIYKEKPDHIYCQLIRMADYVKDINHVPKTLDYMDAFSVGMKRRAGDSKFPMNRAFTKEALRLRAYESGFIHDFDVSTIISEQDREFIKAIGSENIRVVRNGVDTEVFSANLDEVTKDIDVLFVGNLSYYPNVKAAEYLAEKVFPLLQEKYPQIKVAVAGANPSAQLQKLNKPGFEILGWVDNIVTVYRRAKIFMAPLFHGSGLQNKILEAMACGVPVISTSLTNNAIGANTPSEILLADDAEGYLQQTIRLFESPHEYDALIDNARNFVVENYSWETFVKQLEEYMQAS